MTRYLSFPMAVIAMLCLMLGTSSCSKERSRMLSSIPASSTVVVAIDVKKLATDASEQMLDNVPAAAKALAEEAEGHFVYGVLPAGTSFPYALALVKDPAAVAQKAGLKPTTTLGTFESIYTSDEATLLVREGQAWMFRGVEPAAAADILKNELALAQKNPIADVPTVGTALAEAKEMITVAAHSVELMKMFDFTGMNFPLPNVASEYSLIDISVVDNTLLVNSTAIDAQGNEVAVPGLQTLSTDFLRFVPAEFNFVGAMGISKDFDWDALFKTIQNGLDYEHIMVFEMLKPYLRSIDGTVALGCHIPSEADVQEFAKGDFSAVPALVMIHMDQAKINEATENICKLLNTLRMPYQTRTNGICSLTVGNGVTLDFGSVNGYFAIATIPLKAIGANPYTQTFQGKDAAMVADIASLQYLFPKANFGINIAAECSASRSTLKIKLNGTEAPILPTLWSLRD